MTTLRVIVDQIIAPHPGELGRFTVELTRELIRSAPRGCEVEGIVASAPPAAYEQIEHTLPGLRSLYKTTLARRELATAWQLGMTTSPGGGLIHAPSLFAPLRRHDPINDGDQVSVTIHDLTPWAHSDQHTPALRSANKYMVKRARKYADAVIVPTHAIGEQLDEIMSFGDRIRVVGSASRLAEVRLDDGGTHVRALLNLPDRYVVADAASWQQHDASELFRAMAQLRDTDIDLVLINSPAGPEAAIDAAIDEASLAVSRVHRVTIGADDERAALLAGAVGFIALGRWAGAGLSILDALAMGTPVVHSGDPSHREIVGDAGIEVNSELAGALSETVEHLNVDETARERLGVLALDRSRAFSWRDSAEQLWRVHAEL